MSAQPTLKIEGSKGLVIQFLKDGDPVQLTPTGGEDQDGWYFTPVGVALEELDVQVRHPTTTEVVSGRRSNRNPRDGLVSLDWQVDDQLFVVMERLET